jgi:hypothetical protein
VDWKEGVAVLQKILLGRDANGRPLYLTPELGEQTHCHVIGGSGTGKSKFLEHLIRQDIHEGNGLCVIDWHGTLFNDLLSWCAWHDVGLYNDYRSLVLVDPTRPHYVIPLNFFSRRGGDVATQVSRRISATVKAWGQRNADEMPTFERVCRQVFSFAVEQNESLVNAAQLLDFSKRELRDFARTTTGDSWVRSQWNWLQEIRSSREWNEVVLSTENRLSRFLGSQTIKRFCGLTDGCLDFLEVMEKGTIVLVNLGDSDFLSREEARVFAALLLNEFFEAAMRRAAALRTGEKPRQYVLVLDEFQEYISDDLAAMLDQVRKGGLHLMLAHQHLGHFADNPRLAKSVMTNARIKAVFGGLDFPDASVLANEMFLPDLNTRQIKKAYWHTTHLYREETRTIRSHSTSSGHGAGRGAASISTAGAGAGSVVAGPVEGWFGPMDPDRASTIASEFSSTGDARSETEFESDAETFGETKVPVFVPIPTKELASESEWSREEKLSKVAEILKHQQQRHCFVKLNLDKTQPLLVPKVKEHYLSPTTLLEYETALYESQGALSAATADRVIAEREQRFLKEARVQAKGTGRARATGVMGHSLTAADFDPDAVWEQVQNPQVVQLPELDDGQEDH